MARRDGGGKITRGDRRPGYNPMNVGYSPKDPKGDGSQKVPAPPKGGTAAKRPGAAKKMR